MHALLASPAAAALGRQDAFVFTAGIGKHAASVREAVLRQAHWLGLDIHPAANAAGCPRVSPPGAAVSV